MTSTPAITSRPSGSTAKGIAVAGLQAFGLAAVLNAAWFFVAHSAGWFPDSVILPSTGGPLTVGPVIVSTLVGSVGATAVRLALGRMLAGDRAGRVFVIVSVVFLLASFASPLSIPNVPMPLLISLNVMHVIAAVVLVSRMRRVA